MIMIYLQSIGNQLQMQHSDELPKRAADYPKWFQQVNENRIQNVAGALVGEYYRDSKGFAENHALVKEIQDDLVRLGYNLGKSGKDKNGVDGDLGAKTILALHNFEQDHAFEVIKAARTQAEIQKANLHKKDSPNR